MRTATALNSMIAIGTLSLTLLLSQQHTAFAGGFEGRYAPPCENHIYQNGEFIVVCDENQYGAVRRCYYQNNNGQPGQLQYCVFGDTNLPSPGPGGTHR